MSALVDGDLESVMAEMQALARQEAELYGSPAGGQPGKEDCPPPPEYCGPPDDYYGPPSAKPAEPGPTADISLDSAKPMDIRAALSEPPAKRDFIVYPHIPAGAVGAIVGTGGTSKTYMSIVLAVAVSIGRTIEPFNVDGPKKVLFITAEDEDRDISGRLYWICEAYHLTEQERQLLDQNLIVFTVRGVITPLMKLDGQNPTRSDSADWLQKLILKYDPALVILDTKSRLYGLDENSNDHGAQWLGLLESLLVGRHGTSIVVLSHTSKANLGIADQHSARGASSFIDNSRFVMTITAVDATEAKGYGLPDSKGLIKMTHTKSSYAMPADPVIFSKNDFGVPVVVDVDASGMAALGNALDLLVEALRVDYPEGVNKRILEKASEAALKTIRDDIVDLAGISKAEWPKVIALGIESARLETVEDLLSAANNKPILIRVRQSKTPDFADEGMAENQPVPTVRTGMDGKTGTSNCPNWL